MHHSSHDLYGFCRAGYIWGTRSVKATFLTWEDYCEADSISRQWRWRLSRYLLRLPPRRRPRPVSAGSKSSSLCPGGTLLTAVSARRLPGGSMAYKYVLRDGRSFENIAPPAGFNIVTASNALLKELNFPPRPAGAAARKTWRAEVSPFGKSRISRSEQVLPGGRAPSGDGHHHARQGALQASMPAASPRGARSGTRVAASGPVTN